MWFVFINLHPDQLWKKDLKNEKRFATIVVIQIQNIIHYLYGTQHDENDIPKCRESRSSVSIILAHSTPQENRTIGRSRAVRNLEPVSSILTLC